MRIYDEQNQLGSNNDSVVIYVTDLTRIFFLFSMPARICLPMLCKELSWKFACV